MSVVLLADRTATAAPRPWAMVSPLAELGAALHRLSSVDHSDSRWAARTWAGLPEELRAECDLFSAIWGGYRWRLLLPTASSTAGIADELARIAAISLDTFSALSAYALAGTDRRNTAHVSPGWLCKRARGRGCGPAADLLVADAATFRSRLLGQPSGDHYQHPPGSDAHWVGPGGRSRAVIRACNGGGSSAIARVTVGAAAGRWDVNEIKPSRHPRSANATVPSCAC